MKSTDKKDRILLRLLLGMLAPALLPVLLWADTNGPQWWIDRGVTNSNSANDYAAANQGQVKNIALKAIAELDADLPGGAEYTLHTLAANLSVTTANTNDYAAVNIGQIKNISKQFFDRLLQVGYQGRPLESGTYPWVGKESSSNDYAMANIGQVKNLFSFDLTLTGTNGLPDWWQNYYFGGAVADPNALAPSGVLINGSPVTILQAYQNGLNPIDFYNGSAPILAITNGNNQTGSPGAFLSAPLVVKVTDSSGTPMAQAPVIFTVTQGEGTLQATATGTNASVLTARTNSSGYAKTYFQLPNTANSQSQITCVPGTGNYAQNILIFTQSTDDGSGSYSSPILPPGNQPDNPPTPPVVSYPAIDVSGGVLGTTQYITLSDSNTLAFANTDNTTIYVYTWANGNGTLVGASPLYIEGAGVPQADFWISPSGLTPDGILYGYIQWGMSGPFLLINGNMCYPSIPGLSGWIGFNCYIDADNYIAGFCNGAGVDWMDDAGGSAINVAGSITFLVHPEYYYYDDNPPSNVIPTDYNFWSLNNNGWAIGSPSGWGIGCSGGAVWEGGGNPIETGVNDHLLAINNSNQVIGNNNSGGFIWQNATGDISLTSLIPANYHGQISNISARLLSNADPNGTIHILLDATFTDPNDGSTSQKTYVLSGPYHSLCSATCTLQEVQLPDGMSSSDIKCLNANGWLAFIHNGSSGSSMASNARMTTMADQSMAAAESTAPAVPSASAGPPIKVVELSPKVKDESGNEIDGSEKPSSGTLLTPFVEVEPATNRIAHREIKVQISDTLKGKKVTWSLEVLPGATPATIRGKWSDSTTHKDRFEASTAYGANGFRKVSQEQGETTIANDGYTAIRVNVPPIGLNQVRIKILIEGASAPVNLIDMEVPAVVVIDPGHGGADSGTVGRTDSSVLEKDLTLAYALALKQKIVEKFATEKHRLLLVMTRTTSGEYMENGLRANLARDKGADVFQSIHFNSSEPNANGNYPRGTLYCTRSTGQVNATEDDALGGAVQGATLGAVQASDSQGKSLSSVAGVFAVLSDSNYGNSTDYHPIRGSLIEVEFLSNEASLTSVKLSGQTGAAIKTKFAADVSDVIFNNIKNQQ